ncbi:hypothetical protein H0H92_001514 [Tricholoma furcatifolium]|nr:hypothetical protein H0H92_001514 [Tricholoma furcatifolium]
MASATSSVSSSSSLGVLPSRTSSSGFADPTVFSNSPLLRPRVNEIEGCCANKVIINIATSLVIPDYSLYYSGPVQSFQPSFYALDDGSLITPPFIEDLSGANLTLLVNGMLLMLFIRNILVSGDYLRRVKVKKKTLFHLLFVSQILAPLGLVPMIMSSFNQSLHCTSVVVLSGLTGIVSLALLLSLDDMPIEVTEDTTETEQPSKLRGWWDYIPDKVASPTSREPSKKRNPFQNARSKLINVIGRSQNRFPSSTKYPHEKINQSKSLPSKASPVPRGISPAPTTGSRLGKFVPSIHLFQKVVKDELLYTTFITATCVVAAVFAAIGLNFKNGLTVTGWIALNCEVSHPSFEVMSTNRAENTQAIHSFGRVVRRHERDALLRQPVAWSISGRGGNATGEKKSRDSQTSTLSSPRYRREEDDEDDPFSDIRRIETTHSWDSESIEHPPADPFNDDLRGDDSVSIPFTDTASSRSSQRSSEALLGQRFSDTWPSEHSISIIEDEREENT